MTAPAALPAGPFASSKCRALFLRFISHLKAACAATAKQLGHREREAVYQRAMAEELGIRYTCELEYPVPVRFLTSDNRLVTLAHERADIVVTPRPFLGEGGPVVVVEVKRGLPSSRSILPEALDQARRYATHIRRTLPVAGVCAVLFDKTGRMPPRVLSELWSPVAPSKSSQHGQASSHHPPSGR